MRTSRRWAARARRFASARPPLGGRAAANGRARAAQRRDVRIGQVRGVDHGGPRAEDALDVQQRSRRHVVEPLTGLVLGRLFGEMDVQRSTRRSPGDNAELVTGHRTHGVDGSPDTHPVGLCEAGDPLCPPGGITITETQLRLVQWAVSGGVQPSGDVAGAVSYTHLTLPTIYS